MPKVRFIASLAVATSLVLTACGGGDGGAGKSTGTTGSTATAATTTATTTATKLSKTGFVTQGDAICKDLKDRLEPIVNTVQTQADLLTIGPKLAPFYEASLASFRALGPPKALTATYADFLANAKAQIAEVVKPTTAADFDAHVRRVQALDKTNDRLARKLGLTACLSGTK